MSDSSRITSIDIMRGLTLLLMLFFNDLFMPGAALLPGNASPGLDGMALADWVFPGFLFIAGMAIPCSLERRISQGQDMKTIARHIIIRSISLLIIGVLMLNTERVNSEFTGMGKNLWAILMFTAVFLVWNKYNITESNFFTVQGLKLVGIAILVALVYKFKSGEFENNGSLITSWWGFPGIIGWGYLVSALIYLLVRDNISNIVVAFTFFLALNILSQLGLLTSLDSLNPFFGVIIEGNVPMIVLAGLLTSLILKKHSETNTTKAIVTIVTIGAFFIIAGLLFRKWFIISMIQATPSQGLICDGISMILFALVYWITDVKKKTGWILFLKPAGENSLTTYLAPQIIYCLIWSTGIPVLFYKESGIPVIVIAGSFIWALMMIGLTRLLVRFNIKLRL